MTIVELLMLGGVNTVLAAAAVRDAVAGDCIGSCKQARMRIRRECVAGLGVMASMPRTYSGVNW
jgi:hypothetical protein